MIDRFPDSIEYYDNADELLREDDLIEIDVRIAGWNKKFRIRALTFEQMTRINQKATIVNKDTNVSELDEALHVYWTIVEGVTRPRFTFTNAQRLSEKNGDFVKELSDEIWAIGRVNKKLFDEYAKSIKDANKIAKGENVEVEGNV